MSRILEDVFVPSDRRATEGFRVHAQASIDSTFGSEVEVWTAYVYLGVEVIWHFSESGKERIERYESLTDFANYSLRRFAERLAHLLEAER